jgi:16S rRNA (uracil1498-N3)-methyltransferase
VNLLLLGRGEIRPGGVVELSDGRADHLQRVLKVAVGQDVRAGVIDGPIGTATVTAIAGATIILRATVDGDPPPRPRVDLLLAVPRPKVMRRLWAQLSAIGVGRILLTNAARVERNYFDTHVLTSESYRPLLVEGLQQARDTRLPLVSIHRQLKVLVEDELDELVPDASRLVADPSATLTVGEAVKADRSERVLLAVGPEGGWNAFEMELLAAHRFRAVGMGQRTLRTDTACVALLTLVHDAI